MFFIEKFILTFAWLFYENNENKYFGDGYWVIVPVLRGEYNTYNMNDRVSNDW